MHVPELARKPYEHASIMVSNNSSNNRCYNTHKSDKWRNRIKTMRAHTHIIISMFFFGISFFFLITSNFYSDPIPEGKEWFYKNNIHHNYIEQNLPKFTVNPFDYYTSYIEKAIIWIGTLFGLIAFIPIINTAMREKYPEIYIRNKKQYIKGEKKNGKKSSTKKGSKKE